MDEPLSRLSRFFRELKRRNVYRVGVTYAVVAFLTLQAAELLFPATTLEGLYDELVLLAFVGFPIALVLAWAFELTPEGVRRTPPAEETADARGTPGPGSTGSRMAVRALVGLGLLAAAAAGVWYLTGGGGETAPGAGERSIAVLPFANLSGTAEARPFARGIHDDLLTRLANVSGLTVISRTAVERYRDTDLATGPIADSLGVRWVMEGGVEKLGDQIQVNAQLIDPRTESHVWADSYRRELTTDSLFALQTEITKRIARSLEAELAPDEAERVERKPTGDLDAYRLYVRGRNRLDRRTEQALREGIELFERAVRRDSGYALAWTGLTDARMLLGFYGHGSPDTLYPRALETARRALRLDPSLAEAHASMGVLYRDYLQDGPAALRELRRAVELKPSYARAHHWLGNLEASLGRPDQALETLERAAALDPNSPPLHAALAWQHWWVHGPSGSALEHARRSTELEPGYAHGHEVEGSILSAAGRQEAAIAAFRRAMERTPEGTYAWIQSIRGIGVARARAGEPERAREMLTRLRQHGSTGFEQATLHAALGEDTAALRALGEVEWRGVRVWALRFWPVFGGLRDEPRFQELMRNINVSWRLNPDGSLPERAAG